MTMNEFEKEDLDKFYDAVLKAGQGMRHLLLHISWQRCGKALHIGRIHRQAFRLEEQKMPRLVGKAHQLVFD